MGGRTSYFGSYSCRTSYGFAAEVDVTSSISSSVDEKVKVTSNDTTADYLFNKVVAGPNITIVEANDGGDEKLVISASAGAASVDDTITCVAGEDLLPRDAIYVNAEGLVFKAIAVPASSSFEIGFTISGALSGANVPVDTRHGKLLDGFTGLTVGSRYFLSGSGSPGEISTLAPDEGESVIYQVGIAKASDKLLFYPEVLVCNFD